MEPKSEPRRDKKREEKCSEVKRALGSLRNEQKEMKGVYGRLFRGRWGSKGRQEAPKMAQDRRRISR